MIYMENGLTYTSTANKIYRSQQKVEVPFPDGYGAYYKSLSRKKLSSNELSVFAFLRVPCPKRLSCKLLAFKFVQKHKVRPS